MSTSPTSRTAPPKLPLPLRRLVNRAAHAQARADQRRRRDALIAAAADMLAAGRPLRDVADELLQATP